MNSQQALIHVAAVLALAAAIPAAHANTTAEGVKCPSGSTARLSNGDRKLVCETVIRVERASVCSPVVFKGNGSIDLNTRIEPVLAGSDNRVRVDGQYTIPEGLTGLHGNPGSHGWDLKRDHQDSVDFWAKEAKDYRFPVTAP